MDDLRDKVPLTIERVLLPTEKVLWFGRPQNRLLIVRPLNYMVVPFVISLLLGILTIIVAFVLGVYLPIAVLIGLVVLLSAALKRANMLIENWFLRRNAIYAITDKRAIVYQGHHGLKPRSVEFSLQTKVTVSRVLPNTIEFNPGLANIVEHTGMVRESWLGKYIPETRPLTFEMLENMDVVLEIIKQQIARQHGALGVHQASSSRSNGNGTP
jgi:hypothetical protein